MGVLYLLQIRRGIIPSHRPTGMTGGCREWKKGPTFGLKRPPKQKSWLRACISSGRIVPRVPITG